MQNPLIAAGLAPKSWEDPNGLSILFPKGIPRDIQDVMDKYK